MIFNGYYLNIRMNTSESIHLYKLQNNCLNKTQSIHMSMSESTHLCKPQNSRNYILILYRFRD